MKASLYLALLAIAIAMIMGSMEAQGLPDPCLEFIDNPFPGAYEHDTGIRAKYIKTSVKLNLDPAKKEPVKRNPANDPCQPPVPKCYCYPPDMLHYKCSKLVNDYSNGKTEWTCVNFRKFVDCADEMRPFCTPNKPPDVWEQAGGPGPRFAKRAIDVVVSGL